MSELLKAAKDVLVHNGGPIDSDDTVDGLSYVMVRMDDFRALDLAVRKFCEECNGTGKKIPSFINIFETCPCQTKNKK